MVQRSCILKFAVLIACFIFELRYTVGVGL